MPTAMALGAAASAFAWWPMLQLIGRSTRVLDLNPATNHVPFPAARLLAFGLPWRDGGPADAVRLTYHTPGAKIGALVSLASLALLGGCLARVHACDGSPSTDTAPR